MLAVAGGRKRVGGAAMELAKMTTAEVKEYLRHRRSVVVPAGSTEQHGALAPLGCDAFMAERICAAAAEKAGSICAPVLPLGMSSNHMAFPGTISLRPGTLSSLMEDTAVSLHTSGFRSILFLSGHGGNRGPVLAAMASAMPRCPGCAMRYMGYWELPGAGEMQNCLFGDGNGYHATAAEVSMYMHLQPSFRPDPPSLHRYPPSPVPGSILDPEEWAARYPEGPAGVDASRASAEAGRALFDFLVGALAGELAAWERGGRDA